MFCEEGGGCIWRPPTSTQIVNCVVRRSADCQNLPCRDDTAVFSIRTTEDSSEVQTYTHTRMYAYIFKL